MQLGILICGGTHVNSIFSYWKLCNGDSSFSHYMWTGKTVFALSQFFCLTCLYVTYLKTFSQLFLSIWVARFLKNRRLVSVLRPVHVREHCPLIFIFSCLSTPPSVSYTLWPGCPLAKKYDVDGNLFEIITSDEVHYFLQAATPEERKDWIRAIQTVSKTGK